MERLCDFNMLDKFDEWKSKQSEEELKKFYENLEQVNNSNDEWLILKCRQMNKTLTSIFNSAEYDCKICNNSGQVYEIVSRGTSKYIEVRQCECIKRRQKNDI